MSPEKTDGSKETKKSMCAEKQGCWMTDNN